MPNDPMRKFVRIRARVVAFIPDDGDAEQHGDELAALFAKIHRVRHADGSASLDLTHSELATLCEHLAEDTEWRLEQEEKAGDIADARADRRAIRAFINKHQELVGKPQPTLHDGTPLVWKRG